MPAGGALYQAIDAIAPGAAITSAPTTLSDPAGRVIYQAPIAPATTAMTVQALDGRLLSAPAA